jgi:diadenosine tetraphosphate (Ap4A) HIT family hydrolase
VPRLLPFLLVAPLVAAAAPCPFCEIVTGTRPAAVVHRDDRLVAFMDQTPRNPGHVLVVPVEHAENYLEMPAETLGAVAVFAQRIGQALREADLKAEGITLQMNTGRAAGQSVFHAHLHVIPRHAGDRGLTPRAPGEATPTPLPELEAVAAQLRAALAARPEDPAAITGGEAADIRSEYALPALGEEVPLSKIREICAHYGLHALWRKIQRDPPPRPFRSDGCTGWFDDRKGVRLYPAGFLHDLKYWAGYPGEEVERLVADAELMRDVARLLGSTEMAETMFHGVRVGGSDKFKASFSWAFGRQAEKKSEKR